MTTLLTPELIDRCHSAAKAKGFWDETPPKGQQLMLVISELAESLEAHRKDFRADSSLYAESMQRVAELTPRRNQEEGWQRAFVACYKDTVEDELADAYIRICDFVGGFELDKDAVLRSYHWSRSLSSNYAATLLEIVDWVVSASKNELAQGYYLGTALSSVQALAEREGIDLATHIDLKLRYNATRPAKHGKAY